MLSDTARADLQIHPRQQLNGVFSAERVLCRTHALGHVHTYIGTYPKPSVLLKALKLHRFVRQHIL